MHSDKPTSANGVQIAQIVQQFWPVNDASFARLWSLLCVRDLAVGEKLFRVGDEPATECFVLHGIVRGGLSDAQGREVTLDFYVGPCAMTPAIARTQGGQSRIDCEALTAARVALFPAEALSRLMVDDPVIARWGDAVLTQELIRRVDKEMALATQSAKERLQALYADKPQLLGAVAQHHIASYLGITPVSLSRLRGQFEKDFRHLPKRP